jgi:hypothetical protein
MGSRKLATSIDEVLDLSWSDASEGEDTYGNDDDDNANIDSSLALSEVSSSGGAKSDQHHHHPCKMTEVKAIEHMAKTETQSLRLWRFVLFGILLVAGSIVSIGTHRYLSSQERQEAMESVSCDV